MRKALRALFWTAAVLGVIVVALRLTVLEWWTVPSDDPMLSASIAPSLAPGDTVLLWRHSPTFGDLARCVDPQEPRRFVIGRLLGEAGDSLEFDGQDVIVNNKRGVQEHSCSQSVMTVADPTSGSPIEVHCGVEALINHKHKRATSLQGNPSTIKRKVTVSDGNVYLVSDNRVHPLDSREYGALPKATCKEQIFFRIVSSKGFGDVESRFTFIQ